MKEDRNRSFEPARSRLLKILGLLAIGAAVEYYFFWAPDIRPAHGATAAQALERPGEKHLKNIRQLTNGGENAEAYWSFDGKKIILQSTREGLKADQIFIMNADGSNPTMVSTGKGRTTCSYFLKDGKHIVYGSTHGASPEPPPPPDFSLGYVWAVYPGFDIYRAKVDGSDLTPLTQTPGYDAEATVSPDGKRIVFTSMRDGDLDIYTMDTDGKDVRRLTTELGYDGGAFFSPNGKEICYRAGRPETEAEKKEYQDLLARNLVRPSKMDLYIMNVDGSNKRRLTRNGGANFCPFFTRDGKKLIFSSNLENPKGRNFDLFLINVDGTGLEKVTTDETFDGFPMFSPNGKHLVWASNRNSRQRGETNIFLADWVD